MKHKFFIAMILMFGFVGPAMSDTVSSAQRILNQLGYNAGPIDGAYGKKTRSALEIFYSENGSLYDGKLDANEVVDLTAAMDAAGLDTYQVSKVNEFNGKHIYKILWRRVPESNRCTRICNGMYAFK